MFGLKTKDKIRKQLNEDSLNNLKIFCRERDASLQMVATSTGPENLVLSTEAPQPSTFKKKGILCLRMTEDPLSEDHFTREIIFFEVTKQALKHLFNHFEQIYMPILHNPKNQKEWSDLVTKDLMEKFNNYLAQVYVTIGLIDGQTLLPLPPQKLAISNDTLDKDKAHIFEGSIITWTRQIKGVLKLEPEQALKVEGENPGPHTEIEFWKKKSDNLNSIYQQLQSDRVKKILKFLDQNKSTYTIPFTKLQNEVKGYRTEANDNYKFLQTLRDHFDSLTSDSRDFTSLYEDFLPIMHTILLIWKHSKYYNTPPRLVVLIREICNAIIEKAVGFINGRVIS
jgi:dynein heavy chain